MSALIWKEIRENARYEVSKNTAVRIRMASVSQAVPWQLRIPEDREDDDDENGSGVRHTKCVLHFQ